MLTCILTEVVKNSLKRGAKMFFVEYSKSQKCFHVDEVKRSLKSNLQALRAYRPTDYIPIGLFETCEEAHKYVEIIRKEEWAE